jgi:hypothetical protein
MHLAGLSPSGPQGYPQNLWGCALINSVVSVVLQVNQSCLSIGRHIDSLKFVQILKEIKMQIITNLTNHLSHLENKPELSIYEEITFVGNRPLDYVDTKFKNDLRDNDFEDDTTAVW